MYETCAYACVSGAMCVCLCTKHVRMYAYKLVYAHVRLFGDYFAIIFAIISRLFRDMQVFECVCISVSMYACISMSMHVCISVGKYTHISVSMHVCISVSMHVCISISMNVCISVSMHVCISVSMNVCISMSMHVCIPISMYAHISMSVPLRVCMYACWAASDHMNKPFIHKFVKDTCVLFQ
jgi:hypothetical protein